jgi:NAD(P)H dehydrogenase (quinone)
MVGMLGAVTAPQVIPGGERRGPTAYADAAAMRKALEGASTLILVSEHVPDRRGP